MPTFDQIWVEALTAQPYEVHAVVNAKPAHTCDGRTLTNNHGVKLLVEDCHWRAGLLPVVTSPLAVTRVIGYLVSVTFCPAGTSFLPMR